MRGLLYLLAVAGVVAAQDNQTVRTPQAPPSPSTTDEPLFSVAGGGAYKHETCQAVTKTHTHWKDKPYTLTITQPKETVTTTCYETTTVHDTTTSTLTSTTTCTVVSIIPPIQIVGSMLAPKYGSPTSLVHCQLYQSR